MDRERKERKRSKLLTGIIVGSVAGMAVAMFDKSTRQNVAVKVKRCSQRTTTWMKEVRKNPQAFLNNVKHNVNQVSKTAREVADDIQLVFSKLNEVKETSSRVLDTVKEADEEMKEIGKKIIHMDENKEDKLSSNDHADRST